MRSKRQLAAMSASFATDSDIFDRNGVWLAIFAFIGMTYIAPNWILIPAGIIVVARATTTAQILHLKQTWLVILFVVLALINFVIHAGTNSDSSIASLAIMMYPLCLFFAPMLNSIRFTRAFIVLTAIASAAGIIEFIYHVPAFLPGQTAAGADSYEGITGLQNLYFMRVQGLSANSSDFAQMGLIGLTLVFVQRDNLRRAWRIFAVVTSLTVLIVTFNRTTVVALAPMLFVLVLNELRSSIGRWFTPAAILGAVVLAAVALPFLELAFFRGNSGFSEATLSGRAQIWEAFLVHIENAPFLGNGSNRLYVLDIAGHLAHAHNSFLEILATYGLFPIFPLLWAIFLGIRRRILLPLFCLMIYCTFQYGVFWNFSILDVLLWALLLKYESHDAKISKNEYKNPLGESSGELSV